MPRWVFELAISNCNQDAVLLVLVALVHEAVLAHCGDELKPLCMRALDVARRRALGQADDAECKEVSDLAQAAFGDARSLPMEVAQSMTEAAALRSHKPGRLEKLFFVGSVSGALSTASILMGYDPEFRDHDNRSLYKQVLLALNGSRDRWDVVVTANGCVVTLTSVWLRVGEFDGRWVRRDELTDVGLVWLDRELERDEQTDAGLAWRDRELER
jgi:hypothetical protein